MATQPVTFQNPGNTLGSLYARCVRWAREPLDKPLVYDAINDGIESLWMAAMQSTLSKFIKGPVAQFIPSQSQSLTLVTIPDPTANLVLSVVAGGNLPARAYSFTFTYVTDSGSETAQSPSVTLNPAATTLARVIPPALVPDAAGWNLYCDPGNGRPALQNPSPLPFTQAWIEPPLGMFLAPNTPAPPHSNTTGDNICSIARLDVANQDQTFTTWIGTDISSTLFTMYQNRYPLASTFPRHAFDLINNTRIEFRPAAGIDLDATLFYVVRPRRLRFESSRIPFTSFPSEAYLFAKSMGAIMASLEETGQAAAYEMRAEQEKSAIQLTILGENWNRNTTVKPYMRY